MHKKAVLVDLDRTLIDTNRIIAHRFAILKRFGIKKAHAKHAYRVLERKGVVGVDHYINFVARGHKDRRLILKEFYGLYAEKELYNFEGARAFLELLYARKHSLVLLTYGHKEHQLKKLSQSGLGRFFERIIVTTDPHKGKDVRVFHKKHGRRVVLVDDSKNAIDCARRVGIKALRVKAGHKDKEYYRKIVRKIDKSFD